MSPGDALYAAGAHGGALCTLGYTFTDSVTDLNYGITAGHCDSGPSRYVVDRTTGAIGHFVLTAANPKRPLDDDYGLIDFGRHRSVPIMYGMAIVAISDPDPRNVVCHDGMRTGIACGALDSHLGPSQYLTSGMRPSIPGDSGGPVWQPRPNNTATIIGIWLGEHNEPTGAHYGRFITLGEVAARIAAKTRGL
ncbi:hypothetical protein AN933_25445 [Mycobacterium intracellulare subsp. chimaera]|nr:hypothetical protein AN933_25445 [Mycobacterium intracellulare subsp. chimaera]